MKAVISTSGRFHLFALARELEARGNLERIYSGFHWRALEREQVSRDKVTTFPWFRTPLMALQRYQIKIAPLNWWFATMSCVALDSFVARQLPACDIFIGHDGAGLKSGQEAQRRGQIYVTDTGTSHVRFRGDLLKEEYAAHKVEYVEHYPTVFRRQLAEYDASDAIVVPSKFARDSFLAEGFPASKLKLIPYGVRTDHFYPTGTPPDEVFRVLFVGHFSIRKGARYILEAFRDFPHPKKELLIVGAVAQETQAMLASMNNENIKQLGVVPNLKLKDLYSTSHAFLFPSIEDGFGMVIAEAMACGCPVIASANTGAADLYEHGSEGFVVPIRDSRAIRDSLVRLADEPGLRAAMSAAAIERIKQTGGWSEYGDKYTKALRQLVAERQPESRAVANPAMPPSGDRDRAAVRSL